MKRYEKYKDSGEHWLREVPEHWELTKLKWVFVEKKKITNPQLNSGAISFGRVVYKDDEKIPEATKLSYQVVNKGEFLLNPLNLNYDLKSLRIALSDIDVVVSSGYIVLKNKVEINKEYFKWLLHIYDIFYMKTLGAGVRQTINFKDISESLLVLPSPVEQQAISEFLDDKTAKIDQLIAIKEKEINLLKERRQILIQKAVTKGLDPNVKMKDSGVEWIGEIPEHWEVMPGRTIFTERKEGNKGLKNSVVLSLSYGKIIIKPDEKMFGLVPESFETYQLVYQGDIIIRGTDLQNDKTSLRTGLSYYNGIITSAYLNLIVINSSPFFIQQFLYVMDISKVIYKYGSGLRQNLSFNDFKLMPILKVPLDEQTQITSYLKKIEEKITKATSLKQQEIEKLKEYKTILIDNVVTGKMKVV
ncbi:restriction endonuclease subunit S [Kaistella sp. PBT33-4]|uniref:restriction endonuclease subunit S n=1 Tax=Kaistella sp. PBT33-4 TaxID=3032000 RepID=UPI0023D8552A|nr:restriction endonuclease subunit S [Kaistella sp. PBT33-4]MDF0718927.1 restriction endonuclease subunit S [Kaistella sp. PBT33-4]